MQSNVERLADGQETMNPVRSRVTWLATLLFQAISLLADLTVKWNRSEFSGLLMDLNLKF